MSNGPPSKGALNEGQAEMKSLSSEMTDKVASPIELERMSSLDEDDDRYNVLRQYSEAQVVQMGIHYANTHGLDEELFARAAALARAPKDYENNVSLNQDEKEALRKEENSRWNVPSKLIQVIALGSVAAAVQGMDESVLNGANLFFPTALGVDKLANSDLIQGLINGAPYLCSACISCWMSDFCNRKIGRKWTIFWACMISGLSCFWQAFVNTWWHLLIARFILGFGIGIKSATVPAYAAECSPKRVRGSLVMMWQFFTSAGIMFGYVSGLVFYHVPDRGISGGLNWRLMLGSACIPAIIIVFQIPFVPESPRWLMGKGRHIESFESLKALRSSEISAARDCFYQYVLLKEEGSYELSFLKKVKEMFTVRRNRNAAIASWITMFMQDFCGVNVISFYSSSILVEGGFSTIAALLGSWGWGTAGLVSLIPSFFIIDSFGRRNLLLVSLPLMAAFLLLTMGGFWIDQHGADLVVEGLQKHVSSARTAVIILGMYLFVIAFSLGEGPIPFTYSGEAFPLYIRDVGMSFATATVWFFNFILAFTWPRMQTAFTTQGALGWYAGWNMIGFLLVLWFLPETKGLTLEELDEVFDVNAISHAKWHTQKLIHDFKKNILRKNVPPMEPIYKQIKLDVTNSEWNEKVESSCIE
ncbi:uncharacterized protein PRCAT00005777001 [Priceomyces carsonii]|uniref:uncharacterized protein n=1 Tax=Priceomyces carsonii TaxID=28549 RepID=UPI002ED9A3B7|nr:unnamed protein product [Priceomyces carsonii]